MEMQHGSWSRDEGLSHRSVSSGPVGFVVSASARVLRLTCQGYWSFSPHTGARAAQLSGRHSPPRDQPGASVDSETTSRPTVEFTEHGTSDTGSSTTGGYGSTQFQATCASGLRSVSIFICCFNELLSIRDLIAHSTPPDQEYGEHRETQDRMGQDH